MDLKSRLDLVTERAVLLQILNDVKEDPDNFRNVVEAFCESLELFGKFMTPKEFTSKLEPVLLAQDPIRTIIDFSKSLIFVKDGSFRDVMTVLNWVKSSVEQSLQSVILDSLKATPNDFETLQRYREFAVACVSLPQKISNCRSRATTDEHVNFINSTILVFKHHLLLGTKSTLSHAHMSNSSSLKSLAELISAGRNMEVEDQFPLLYKTVEWIGRIENFDEKWRKIMRELFATPTSLGVQVHEALLTSLFLGSDNETQLERCLPVADISGTLKRVVLVKLPFQRVLEPWTMKLLVDFVIRTRESLAHGMLETAIKLWSDVNYANKASEEQEQHLVRMIIYLIHRFRKSSDIPWNDFFLHSSNGVYTRLQSLPLFRRTALFMSQTLSKLAAEYTENFSENPPKIDELTVENDEWTQEIRDILENGIKKKVEVKQILETLATEKPLVSTEKPSKTVLKKVIVKKGLRRFLTVRKVNVPLDSDDDEDDEEFPKYAVEETEKQVKKLADGEDPNTSVTPPTYIQDAFEQLLEKEKYAVFEAAFFALPSLIRRKAIGFSSLAEQLVLRVVNLQNRFGTKKFDETVEEIAVSAISHRPEIVPNLIRIIIAPGQGERVQQKILHFVHKAADEMGSLDEKQALHVKTMQRRMEVVHTGLGELSSRTGDLQMDSDDDMEIRRLQNPGVPEWRWEVDARIASKTRIISRGHHKQVGVVNRLAQNVQYMFYPLLVMPRGEMIRLLNQDSDLLALIIIVSSMVYVRCGKCPSIWKMTTELLSYVRPHRYSENPKVRTACLAAHINVLSLLPKDLILQLIPDEEMREWHTWAELVLMNQNGNAPRAEIDMATHLARAIYEYFEARNQDENQ